jgi:hypothetical protein
MHSERRLRRSLKELRRRPERRMIASKAVCDDFGVVDIDVANPRLGNVIRCGRQAIRLAFFS